VTDYYYNALGHRMRDHLQGVECWAYTYDGDRVIEDNCLGALHVRSRYTPESGSYYTPLLGSRRCCLSSIQFPIYDGVGTVRGVVNSAGTLQASYAFDAFGKPLPGNTATNDQSRYGGGVGLPHGQRQHRAGAVGGEMVLA
jgi:hypothetical protein